MSLMYIGSITGSSQTAGYCMELVQTTGYNENAGVLIPIALIGEIAAQIDMGWLMTSFYILKWTTEKNM